jgi:tetratricopeptide (TPR) repeat protein
VGIDLSAARFAASSGDPWSGGDRSIFANLLTQAKVLALYLGLFVAPVPGRFSASHDVAPAASLVEPGVLAAFAVLGLVVAGVFVLAARRRTALPIVLLLFALAALAPTSSVVPLNVIMAERRLYLPSFALSLAAAALLAAVPLRQATRARGAAVLLAALAIVSALRTRDYRDEATLWAAAASTSPGSPRAWSNYGNAMLDAGEPDSAASHYARAIAIRPNDFLAHANRGTALQAVAERTKSAALFAEAAAEYERSIALNPAAGVLGHKLGRCHLALARTAGGGEAAYLAAAAAFEAILETYPEDGLALVFLAGSCREAGRSDSLLLASERLVAAHPERMDFRTLRGEALVETGRADEAIDVFQELARLRPNDALAYRGLAAALRKGSRPDEAGALEAEAAAERADSTRPGRKPVPPAEPPPSGDGSK